MAATTAPVSDAKVGGLGCAAAAAAALEPARGDEVRIGGGGELRRQVSTGGACVLNLAAAGEMAANSKCDGRVTESCECG
jgi:hypothetical protein